MTAPIDEIEPCTKFSCQNFHKCRSEKMACKVFYMFVQSGYSSNPINAGHRGVPSKAVFNDIYGEKNV